MNLRAAHFTRTLPALLLTGLTACAPAATNTPSAATDATTDAATNASGDPLLLPGSDGRVRALSDVLAENQLSVFVFWARDCPCVAAHESRVAELAREFGSRGVGIFWVDSELGATAREDAAEAQRRGYTIPLLTDVEARLARRYQAEFATHAVVLDRSGRVRYSGGLDSDKKHLHDDAEAYLRPALDALLAGREPDVVDAEALGCVLQLR
ncbi:MAG TPA: redoxin family protein [Polyangiaceae bacterium]|nr:redoxin family protein [Polyangiaceae bacterium]